MFFSEPIWTVIVDQELAEGSDKQERGKQVFTLSIKGSGVDHRQWLVFT
jgi:hypothetical protein